MHHKTCSNSTFSMRHNAMFEGCWAERLFLKYQNIKICAWKWWAEYLKYLNISNNLRTSPCCMFQSRWVILLVLKYQSRALEPLSTAGLSLSDHWPPPHLLLWCIKTPTSPWIKTPPPSCPKLPTPSICQQILQETSTPILSCLPVSFCHIPDF